MLFPKVSSRSLAAMHSGQMVGNPYLGITSRLPVTQAQPEITESPRILCLGSARAGRSLRGAVVAVIKEAGLALRKLIPMPARSPWDILSDAREQNSRRA